MPTAGFVIMFPYVFATKASLAIHSLSVTNRPQQPQDQRLLTLVDLLPVESTQNVEKEVELPPVPVYLDSLEILMLNANLSVPSTQSVLTTEPVFETSVLIPVLECAGPMQHAKPSAINLSAPVTQDTLEIHSPIVTRDQHLHHR